MEEKKNQFNWLGCNQQYTVKRVVVPSKPNVFIIIICYVFSMLCFAVATALMILSEYLIIHESLLYTLVFAGFFLGGVLLKYTNPKPTPKKEEYFIHIPHKDLK